MIQYFIPITLLLCLSCNSQEDKTSGQNKAGWKKPELEGHWKFVSAVIAEDTPFLSYYPNPHTPPSEEGPLSPPYKGPDLIFENDTVYEIHGLMEFVNRTPYSIDSGYLHFGRKWRNYTFPAEFVNDTLFIYKPLYEKEYAKEGYVKTSFNDSVVNILIEQGVNYPALAGTWYLIRSSSGGDGTFYELDFPHTIPDSIEISREEFISGLEQNNMYMMSTDGQKREYFFSFSWNTLYLTPGSWYRKEGDTGLMFSKYSPGYNIKTMPIKPKLH